VDFCALDESQRGLPLTKKRAAKKASTRSAKKNKPVSAKKWTTPRTGRKTTEVVVLKPVTREELIADIQAIQDEFPEVTISRNFYRKHGAFKDDQWEDVFSTFPSFVKAAAISPASKKAKKEQADIDEASTKILFEESYIFNPANGGTYITFLKNVGRNVTFSKDRHEAMLRSYSNWDGDPQTINEICRDFTIPRSWFHEYKAIHGWTHDHEPFTAEEMVIRPEEEMVEDALQMKRLAVHRKTQKALWQKVEQDAKKWNNWEQSVFIPLLNKIELNLPEYKVPMMNFKPAKEKFAVVVAPFDLHFGMFGWEDETGHGYSRLQARARLIEHTSHLANYIKLFGRPVKVICASASDYLHVDNAMHTTTKGTPQDVDGTYDQILSEGMELAVDHANLLLQMGAPLEWLGVKGNHDSNSAAAVMMYMKGFFRNDKRVKVDFSAKLRRATTFGNSFLGFFHGHNLRVPNLASVMQQDFLEQWRRSDWYYAFSGHLHHEISREINGIKHFQVSSLAGTDRYHGDHGYITSTRAMQAYLVSENRGVFAEFISPVLPNSVVAGTKVKQVAKTIEGKFSRVA
jgi:hypothetical protein